MPTARLRTEPIFRIEIYSSTEASALTAEAAPPAVAPAPSEAALHPVALGGVFISPDEAGSTTSEIPPILAALPPEAPSPMSEDAGSEDSDESALQPINLDNLLSAIGPVFHTPAAAVAPAESPIGVVASESEEVGEAGFSYGAWLYSDSAMVMAALMMAPDITALTASLPDTAPAETRGAETRG